MTAHRIKALLVAIAVLLLISCSRKTQPRLGFISELGEHFILPPDHVLRIFDEGGRVNYRLKAGEDTWAPQEPPIEQGTPWFFFVETPERVWVYDGKEDLRLLAKKGTRVGVYSLKVCGSSLRDQVPAEVARRVPGVIKSEG